VLSSHAMCEVEIRVRQPIAVKKSQPIKLSEAFWPVSAENNLAYPYFHEYFRQRATP
jgi:hypothetical protein